jgi:hypothetical protein
MALARRLRMRALAIGLLLAAALATPSGACPRELRCIVLAPVQTEEVDRPEVRFEVRSERPHVRPGLAAALPASDTSEHRALRTELITFEPRVTYADQVEMPWIWEVLSAEVKSRLPHYDQAEAQFSMMLAPVVVTSPSESTPGLGLSGDF